VSTLDERLATLAQELVIRFPECTLLMANELVSSVAAQFETAPIQDYVPVLTARICRERLRGRRSDTLVADAS
jgi:hypothetical protein